MRRRPLLTAIASTTTMALSLSAASARPGSARGSHAVSDTVDAQATLRSGAERRSRNGRYRLIMQRDGNLVLYRLRPRRAVWSSQTAGHNGAYTTMQRDGNLVLYSPARKALFATGTRVAHPPARAARLVMRDDSQVVVVRGGSPRPVWSSRTDLTQLDAGQLLIAGQHRLSPDGRFLLTMQTDGDLVVYQRAGRRALWSSQTGGHQGAFANMQADGNLVVYSASLVPLFATATAGSGTRLVMQRDGDAVLRPAAGVALWSSTTDVSELSPNQWITPGQSRRSPDGAFALVMQPDGNLVLSDTPTHAVLFASGTGGNAGARTLMQGDGNLVVDAPSGQALFTSGSAGNPGARLIVGSNGTVELVGAEGGVVWSE